MDFGAGALARRLDEGACPRGWLNLISETASPARLQQRLLRAEGKHLST
jgi:hypothetical protein